MTRQKKEPAKCSPEFKPELPPSPLRAAIDAELCNGDALHSAFGSGCVEHRFLSDATPQDMQVALRLLRLFVPSNRRSHANRASHFQPPPGVLPPLL